MSLQQNSSRNNVPYTEVFYGDFGRHEFLEAHVDEKLNELIQKHVSKGIQDISLQFDVEKQASREPEFECSLKLMTRNGKVIFSKKTGSEILSVFERVLASVEKSLKREWMKRRRGLRMVDPRTSPELFSGINFS